ncbi:MAG: hypothetical protein JXR64_01920 [Spirochaetales bacterium]|nr:hypothetical protein [Spirochaetales bacterium]
MESSKLYSKNVSKIFKKYHDKPVEEYQDEFLQVFLEAFRYLPEDSASEIYSRFVTYTDRDFKDALYNLINVFELFEENYDIDKDPFNEEEWEYIKLIVNESSDELGLDLIKYIMQVMLDLNYLS